MLYTLNEMSNHDQTNCDVLTHDTGVLWLFW